MSAIMLDTPISQRHRPSPRDLDRSGFFAHHGAWALGVRLFRALGFAPKATLISIVFLVPVVVVFTTYLRNQLADENFAATEIQGVTVIKNYAPVLRGAMDLRNAARAATAKGGGVAAVDEERGSFETAIAAFDKFLLDSGDPLQFKDNFAKLHDAYGKAKAASGAHDGSGQAAMDAMVDVAKTVEQDLADKSNLSLDPDASSYYLQSVVTGEVSTIATNLGQMRAWSAYFAAKGGVEAKEERPFVIWDSRVTEHIDTLRDDLARAIAAEPKISINLAPLDIVSDYQKSAASTTLEGQAGDARTLWADGQGAVDALFGVYAQALPVLDDLLQERIDRFHAERRILFCVLGVALVMAAYLFYSFFLVMRGGLNEVRRHLEAMTSGDLTTVARPWGRDEVASLMTSLTQMQDSLRAIVGSVRLSSDAIVNASNEIASASMDLSSRTEAAAADLEESAASMEQITSTVTHTSNNAVQAAALAASNSEVAQRGGQVIGDVVSTMQEIHLASSKIAEIISTIDGIAFQTNILALNASVEAARAGDQGRGFAVVADEVRNLAQRSAQAAKEIKGLITASVEKVASGTRVVQGAGSTMKELVDNARRMNDLLAEISTASREQSSGITQIGTAVHDLDRMTEQNAALVEETAAAAATLKNQASDLADRVSRFQLPQTA